MIFRAGQQRDSRAAPLAALATDPGSVVHTRSHRCCPRLLDGEYHGNLTSSREIITSVRDSDKYHEPAIADRDRRAASLSADSGHWQPHRRSHAPAPARVRGRMLLSRSSWLPSIPIPNLQVIQVHSTTVTRRPRRWQCRRGVE